MPPRLRDLRARTDDLFTRGAHAEALPRGRRFSAFADDDLAEAVELADRLMAAADTGRGNDGLQLALDEAERALAERDPDLVQHALMIFITHHPKGSALPIPALEERRPEAVASAEELPSLEAPEAVDREAAVAWFREDPLANQHHEHWHVVYPSQGVPDGRGGVKSQDRQGEIFLYMHQQMLARYDAERLAGGLERVRPLASFRRPIAEGYDSGLPGMAARPPRTPVADVGRLTVAGQEQSRRRLTKAATSGRFADGREVTADAFGATLEASPASASREHYGGLHNAGHMLIAYSHDPSTASGFGVMAGVDTAIRDPVFYRWHRHVDDLHAKWQDGLPPHDFADGPDVAVTGVYLCFTDAVPGSSARDFDLQAWAARTFGGRRWKSDNSDLATDELETFRVARSAPTGSVSHLDHRDFFYVVRAENRTSKATDVTVRIFIAPEEVADDRRAWIEMDKFPWRLRARQKAVVARPAALSSVVQKPAVRPPRPRREPGPDAADNYCNCGWPFHLLVPKGRPDGMRFRLFVMLTDWQLDQVPADHHCGSMSFCGARDSRYPDRRSMGYPFDRPFGEGRTVASITADRHNMALRDFSIRHGGDR